MQNPSILLTSHWIDQYLCIQRLVDANLHKSLDITLNGPIFGRSKSCQCESSQISRHHIEWTNICAFKVLSMQNPTNFSTSHQMDQYLYVQNLVNAKFSKSLDIISNGPIFGHFKVLSMRIFTNLLLSLWMHKYLSIQSLVNMNLHKSLDITLDRPIFRRLGFRQCKSLDIILNGLILARPKSHQHNLLGVTLNGPMLTNSKSRRHKSLQLL